MTNVPSHVRNLERGVLLDRRPVQFNRRLEADPRRDVA